MDVKVHYLFHSGFAVETAAHFLIFDYWRDTPKGGGLSDGVISPRELGRLGKKVVAFASHIHGDHYNPVILEWREQLPDLALVLSDDIPSAPGALMVSGGKTYRQGDVSLRTLFSTDEGVAFLAEVDGLRIYHGGDLNWWHWEGEPEGDNAEMGARYKAEIDSIGPQPIELAFLPVDPRLGEQYAWGIGYFMEHTRTEWAFPMHFGPRVEAVAQLVSDPAARDYRDRVVPLVKRGECWRMPPKG